LRGGYAKSWNFTLRTDGFAGSISTTRCPITRRSRSIAMVAFVIADILRQVFEAVVRACMDAGLVKGEGFAVDASVMEANASRYHGNAPDEIDWSVPKLQTRAAAEFLAGLDDEDPDANRKPPKLISPSDPCSAWTAMSEHSEPAQGVFTYRLRDTNQSEATAVGAENAVTSEK
jgi:hypothetical protein